MLFRSELVLHSLIDFVFDALELNDIVGVDDDVLEIDGVFDSDIDGVGVTVGVDVIVVDGVGVDV